MALVMIKHLCDFILASLYILLSFFPCSLHCFFLEYMYTLEQSAAHISIISAAGFEFIYAGIVQTKISGRNN